MPTSPGRPSRATHPHVRVPTTLRQSGLPAGARDLWALLDDLCREYAAVELTVASAAATLRCSPRAVQVWRAKLVAGGWLAFTPAEHRGQVSTWQPLGRARDVREPGLAPVDNSRGRVNGRVNERAPSDHGKGERACTLDGGATRARVEEQNPTGGVIDLRRVNADADTLAALAGRPSSWPSWCGRCEPQRSLIDSLLTPGALARCPACHPSRPVPAF